MKKLDEQLFNTLNEILCDLQRIMLINETLPK